MTTTVPTAIATSSYHGIHGTRHDYRWTYQNQPATIAYETLGQGSPVLLLPAFSTVSTREEMAGIAAVLASHFQVFTLDWLGFGESARPAWNYQPALYQQLLADFIRDCLPQPLAIIAAGHAAGYAMHYAQQQPESCTKLMLIAPTWKGPLRVMGAPQVIATGIRSLVRSPLVGQFLYGLNTGSGFLKLMYRRHVYVDTEKLTPEFMAHKRQITQQSGARYAPAAFVTGALDPMPDHETWLSVGRSLSLPVKIIQAEQGPPKSKAEMQALAELPQIQSQAMPGSLGLHEEFAEDVGAIALEFLQAT